MHYIGGDGIAFVWVGFIWARILGEFLFKPEMDSKIQGPVKFVLNTNSSLGPGLLTGTFKSHYVFCSIGCGFE